MKFDKPKSKLIIFISVILLIIGYWYINQNIKTVFYISNQASDSTRDTIDISVKIDGVELIKDTLQIGNYHLYKYYIKELDFGVHEIEISSDLGKAVLKNNIYCFFKQFIIIEYFDQNFLEDQDNREYFFIITKKLTPLKIS